MSYKIHPNSLKNLKLPKDYSFTQTKEYKEKMSNIMKKTKRNPNSLKAIANTKFQKGCLPWSKGKQIGKMSDETKNKISFAKKGTPSYNKGKKLTEEHKSKLKKAWSYEKHVTHITRQKQKQNWKILWENNQTWRKAMMNRVTPKKDTKPERMMQIALALNGIKFEKHKLFDTETFYHKVDLFIEPNICVEVDGDYWHKKPEVIGRDLVINHELTIMGNVVFRIWESDIKKNTQSCVENIIKLIQQVRGKIII